MRQRFVFDAPLNQFERITAAEREATKAVPETVRLWHDDIRRAPRGWMWSRTNQEAQRILLDYNVVAASLDHDLGLHEEDPDAPGAIYRAGTGEETGLDLVRWMIDNDRVPERVSIHSMNLVCAMRMAHALADHGYEVEVEPYSVGLFRVLDELGV